MSSSETRITVDRIEDAVAVLVIGDQSVDVPVAALPEGAKEGSVLTLTLSESVDDAETDDAEARLERLRKKNPPKTTFTL